MALRVGLVGCGRVAERGHLPALARVPALELAAACDPIEARRELASGVPAYEDLESMLDREQLDLILICSPPHLHFAHAQTCAERGIQALVEKPPGVTLEETRDLAALRPEPCVGFNRRFARRLPIGANAIADPRRITAIFDAPPADWGGTPEEPLLDLGCHLVDLAFLASGDRPVAARALRAAPGRAEFELELSRGTMVRVSCGQAPTYRELLDVRSEDGRIAAWRWPEPAGDQLIAWLRRRPGALAGSWEAQLRSLAGTLDGDRALDRDRRDGPARASEAVPVMAALEAVRTSMAAGGEWIDVRE